ncbi:hypothetical protein J3F83DRAFT_279022 [Trichoderma novae-zelandiae]
MDGGVELVQLDPVGETKLGGRIPAKLGNELRFWQVPGPCFVFCSPSCSLSRGKTKALEAQIRPFEGVSGRTEARKRILVEPPWLFVPRRGGPWGEGRAYYLHLYRLGQSSIGRTIQATLLIPSWLWNIRSSKRAVWKLVFPSLLDLHRLAPIRLSFTFFHLVGCQKAAGLLLLVYPSFVPFSSLDSILDYTTFHSFQLLFCLIPPHGWTTWLNT